MFFKVMTFTITKKFLSHFLFKIDKWKHCFLIILGMSTVLPSLKQMTWIDSASWELAHNNMMLFFIDGWLFRFEVDVNLAYILRFLEAPPRVSPGPGGRAHTTSSLSPDPQLHFIHLKYVELCLVFAFNIYSFLLCF